MTTPPNHNTADQSGAMQPTSSASSADKLAELIRQIDGNHSMGAGELAEALLPHLSAIVPPVAQAPCDVLSADDYKLWATFLTLHEMEIDDVQLPDLIVSIRQVLTERAALASTQPAPKRHELKERNWRLALSFGAVPVLYVDEINGDQTCRDDLWLATTGQLAQTKCRTCNDNGMIGGPSYSQPDEGGVPCPDCSQPFPEPAVQSGELPDVFSNMNACMYRAECRQAIAQTAPAVQSIVPQVVQAPIELPELPTACFIGGSFSEGQMRSYARQAIASVAAPIVATPKLTECRHCGFMVALNQAPADAAPIVATVPSEPVAWMWEYFGTHVTTSVALANDLRQSDDITLLPLYAAPSPTEQASDVRDAALVKALQSIAKESEDEMTRDCAIRALKSAPAAKGNAQDEVKETYTTGHCEHNNQPGGCQQHNLHCGWPKCDQKEIK